MLVRSMSIHWWERRKAGRGSSWAIRYMHLWPQASTMLMSWAERPLPLSIMQEEEMCWADLLPPSSYSKYAFGVIYDYLKSHGVALHRGPALIGQGEPVLSIDCEFTYNQCQSWDTEEWHLMLGGWYMGRSMGSLLISWALFPGSGYRGVS